MSLLATALCPGLGMAQPSTTLNRFSPSEQTNDGFATSTAEDQGHLRLGAQLYLDYAHDPLVYEYEQGSRSEEFHVVDHQLTGNLDVSLGIKDRYTVFIGLPIVLAMTGDGIPDDLSSIVIDGDGSSANGVPVYLADGSGVGDLYVGARARLWGTTADRWMIAAAARLTLPTGSVNDSHHYSGEESVSFWPEFIVQLNQGRWRIVGNLGALIRSNVPACDELDPPGRGAGANCFLGASVRDELTFGFGATAKLLDDGSLWALLELYGSTSFTNFFDREETPLELLAGVKYFHQSGLVAGLGMGPGLTRGFGSPDVRVLGMVGWADPADEGPADRDSDGILDSDDACPDVAEDVDAFEDEDGCPDPDNDLDGVLDADDACPMEPEDEDNFEDGDGCPDPDNDEDGILDASDQCPLNAEDVDGFEDEDGCTDEDNDGDSILDIDDRCPVEPGDASNVGCPIADTDGDGVPDAEDSCVHEPGTVEHHGCPREAQAVITDGQIQILHKVHFGINSHAIDPRSFSLLDAVAQVLVDHPQIARVSVDGHTDANGSMSANMSLSERRANAVMEYLIEQGVDASRLEAHGYGPTRPLVQNARTRAQHAQNRRVEFLIVESGGVEVEHR